MASEIPAPLTQGLTAPLNDRAKALVRYLYPDGRGHMPQYLNVSRLRTYGGEGVLAKLFCVENQVLAKTKEKIKAWEMAVPSAEEVFDFEKSLTSFVLEALKAAFPTPINGDEATYCLFFPKRMWLSSPFSLPFIKPTRKKATSDGNESQASMLSLF
ncbi:MAG: hypothetical protein ACUVR0_02620 [Candidatus Aminicenantales bacterium]